MFNRKSFEIFEIVGLEPRMMEIRAEIQPIFREIGEKFLTELSSQFPEKNFYQHIAQHRRRTANAPDATLTAFSENKRGYKMLPHIQLGLCRDYVFVYLGIIDAPKNREIWADRLSALTMELPSDFVVSKNHMNSTFFDLMEFTDAVHRLKTVKKADFELGRIWTSEQFSGQQDETILAEMLLTVKQLAPIYQKLMEA